VHDTAKEDAATYNSGLYSGTNRHVNCLDCHDTHMAGKTKHTVGGANGNAIATTSPLYGVSGVGYTGTLPANFAAIPSTNLAKVATATAEYQICFKCHTGWAFGTTPPTGTSGLAETDLSQEFNVNNKAAHPVVNTLASQTGSTAKGLVATQLLAPWNASPGAQTMACSDCHNTDAASTAAQGPHGSAVTFMLKGANKAWPYTVAGATSGTLFRVSTSETGLNTNNGLFCRNCHPQMNSTGSNSLHRNSNITGGQHGNGTPSACVSCHLRIPHGGKVSRLLVTTNAPARYKVGTSNFAQITKGATKDSYSTSGFPSGFKSSCSEHSSGTGNEAW
jgi:nitrate/TMAO reductase-like tetraheme cytochrome c subunit